MSNESNPTLMNLLDQRQVNALELAKTCNDVCHVLFPDLPNQAFLEYQNNNLNEPPSLQLMDLNDDFWALTLNFTVFVANDDQFRQYNPDSGLYEVVQESTLIGQIISNLTFASHYFPSYLKHESFLALKTRTRLKSVVERARDLLQVDQSYFKNQEHILNLKDGLFNLSSNTFYDFSPDHPITEKLPVKYDPRAKCDMLLAGFLRHVLSLDDIDLLQRYCSQILTGKNYSQKILILLGDSGWGKSSLIKIVCSLIAWERVGIVREQLYRNDLELSHYQNKHLLYHPDMPTQFLNDAKASQFKQLVGGDPVWAECKDGSRIVLEGNFPVILACNGKPKINIDQDVEAWARRLVILNFKKPANEQQIGKMAELLGGERSGILNWMLEGRQKLYKDKLQLTQTKEQQNRANLLLLGSDSPSAFVRSSLVKKKGEVMGAADLYEKYQVWCKSHQLAPFSSKQFHQTVKAEIEIMFGLKYRHDLLSEGGGVMRGWKGLGLIPALDNKEAENESKQSDQANVDIKVPVA